jgi:DNA polymerase-3 subunit delta'
MSDPHDTEDTAPGNSAQSRVGQGVAPSQFSRIAMLPWHAGPRERLESAVAGGRLPHAVLLHGPAGVGKEQFAGALAAALLCTGRAARLEACGRCAECALTRAGSHPDLHWLRRPDERKTISVDQVREISERLAQTSMRRGRRVGIATPAHAMTPSAQNALLKTLEEPAAGILLVLVSSRPSGLLATIRSRCQRIEVARPPDSMARDWLATRLDAPPPPRLLELARGAPLRALELAPHFAELDARMCELLESYRRGQRDVTGTAEEMMGEGLLARLDWLENWLAGVARQRLLSDGTPVTLPDGAVLQRMAAEVNITALFGLVDRLREMKRLLDGSVAPQLSVEAWLVALAGNFRSQGVNG